MIAAVFVAGVVVGAACWAVFAALIESASDAMRASATDPDGPER